MTFGSDGAFAGVIQWAAEAQSGYPGRTSRLWGTQRAPKGKIFRGSVPGTIPVAATQVTFTDVDGSQAFGYMFDGKTQVLADYTTADDFYEATGVSIVFSFTVADQIVEVRETQRVSIPLLISAMSGAALFVLAIATTWFTTLEPMLSGNQKIKLPKSLPLPCFGDGGEDGGDDGGDGGDDGGKEEETDEKEEKKDKKEKKKKEDKKDTTTKKTPKSDAPNSPSAVAQNPSSPSTEHGATFASGHPLNTSGGESTEMTTV